MVAMIILPNGENGIIDNGEENPIKITGFVLKFAQNVKGENAK